MNSTGGNEAAIFAGVGLIAVLFILAIALAFYIFFCYCAKRICEKAGHEPGALIWIPIANLVPLLTVAKLPVWFIILFFIPIVGFFVGIYMWFKICEARGKSGWMVLLIFVPVVNLAFIPYLAFSE